jgi:hypothetical protein
LHRNNAYLAAAPQNRHGSLASRFFYDNVVWLSFLEFKDNIMANKAQEKNKETRKKPLKTLKEKRAAKKEKKK